MIYQSTEQEQTNSSTDNTDKILYIDIVIFICCIGIYLLLQDHIICSTIIIIASLDVLYIKTELLRIITLFQINSDKSIDLTDHQIFYTIAKIFILASRLYIILLIILLITYLFVKFTKLVMYTIITIISFIILLFTYTYISQTEIYTSIKNKIIN